MLVPVVVYSAHQVDAADRERLRLGEMTFLTKGYDSPDELARRVVGVVSRVGMAEAAPVELGGAVAGGRRELVIMTARRVLIVDDEDAIREIAQLSMEVVGGHRTTGASSGAEALDRAAADPPDAILLDVMMPGLDGPATVARLQADPRTRDIDVVLLTAKVRPSDLARVDMLPGVAGVIAKPFDPMTLPAQVADILGWDRA